MCACNASQTGLCCLLGCLVVCLLGCWFVLFCSREKYCPPKRVSKRLSPQKKCLEKCQREAKIQICEWQYTICDNNRKGWFTIIRRYGWNLWSALTSPSLEQTNCVRHALDWWSSLVVVLVSSRLKWEYSVCINNQVQAFYFMHYFIL